MSLSNLQKAALLDARFGETALPSIGTLHVGLSSTAPAEDGTNVTEPSGGGYARVAVDNSGAGQEWNAATVDDPAVKPNSAEIAFPESTGAWLAGANLTHVVIYDAATNGNYIGGAALDTARTVDAAGITLRFAAGELQITLS